jgi:restriction system protein
MARRNESLLVLLSKSPWWASVGLSVFVYTGLKHVLSQMAFHDWVLSSFAKAMAYVAPLISLALLAPAVVSLINSWRMRNWLDGQRHLRTIRSLSWREFEALVREAYRSMGYTVRENSPSGQDGGVDLTLRKNGDLALVQCKHWRNMKVGVKRVRELYGAMTAEQASSAIFMTSGSFTHEARLFAISRPIELVDGKRLAALVGSVQKKGVPFEPIVQPKTCPECGAQMVKRVARRGSHAGEPFWGCSAFPDCRAIIR